MYKDVIQGKQQQPCPDAVCRTLICNLNTVGKIPEDECRHSFDALVEGEELLFGSGTIFNALARVEHGNEYVMKLERWTKDFRAALDKYANGRAFRTTAGGRIGMLPAATIEGDIICLFLGGDTPFVIRPSRDEDNAYFFIGECYLHGMMHGEALSEPDFDKRIQEIRLR